jgi:predicted DNA-binding transcriptional regulator YafY
MGKRVLKFRYKVPEWRTGQTREVEPLHLACIADEWYLIAYDRGVQDLRHFAVARVQRVVDESGERFEPRAFDPERYFANRFGRFVGKDGEHVEVAIKFRKDVAAWTTEREWHARQKVRKHADGTLTLSFPSPSLDEVKRWVLQWGSAAEVIEPAELRQQVKDELEEMKRNYAD